MVPFLRNCRLYWDAANQVKNGDQTPGGPIKGIVRNSRCLAAWWKTQNSCQRLASGSEGFSFQPHYHVLAVICLETRRCCALTRRPIVLSGVWTVPLDLSASVGNQNGTTFFFVSFFPNGQLGSTTKDAVERRQAFLHMKSQNGDVKNKWRPNHIIRWYKHVALR